MVRTYFQLLKNHSLFFIDIKETFLDSVIRLNEAKFFLTSIYFNRLLLYAHFFLDTVFLLMILKAAK